MNVRNGISLNLLYSALDANDIDFGQNPMTNLLVKYKNDLIDSEHLSDYYYDFYKKFSQYLELKNSENENVFELDKKHIQNPIVWEDEYANGKYISYHVNECEDENVISNFKNDVNSYMKILFPDYDVYDKTIEDTFENKNLCIAVPKDNLKYKEESMQKLENSLKENSEIVPEGTILYHGSKSGSLAIDFNKDNYLYFTDDLKMATAYSLKKFKNYNVRIGKQNENTKIISVKILKDLLVVRFSNDLTLGHTYSREDIYNLVKSLGYDGVIDHENGFSAENMNDSRLGNGDSYYFFNLNNIEVVGESIADIKILKNK